MFLKHFWVSENQLPFFVLCRTKMNITLYTNFYRKPVSLYSTVFHIRFLQIRKFASAQDYTVYIRIIKHFPGSLWSGAGLVSWSGVAGIWPAAAGSAAERTDQAPLPVRPVIQNNRAGQAIINIATSDKRRQIGLQHYRISGDVTGENCKAFLERCLIVAL